MACKDCVHTVCLGMDCKLAKEDIERVYAKYPALRPFASDNIKTGDKL